MLNKISILKTKNILILLITLFIFCGNDLELFAQIKKGSSLDKVVAIVGKDLILKSEVDQNMAMVMQSNPSINFQDDTYRKKILDNLINEKLMVMKAVEDSVEVSDDEISQRWNEFLNGMIRQYGSESRVEEVIGKTINRAKYEYNDLIKQRLLVDKLTQLKFSQINVSKKEVEEFFEKYRDSIPKVAPKISLYHLVKNVKVNNDLKIKSYEKAVSVRDSILNGGDFAKFATTYSADPGSAADGGNLGWFEKGKLFPEFEKAANNLQKGEISLPIETPFGFHIIQTIDKKKDALNTKHILFKVDLSDDDTKDVINELKSLKDKFQKGEKFEDLAKENSDDKDTKGFGGFLGKLQLEEMPPNLKSVILELNIGDVSDPIPYGGDPIKPAYHIIYKKEYNPEHNVNLDEDYKNIEQLTMVSKRQKIMSDWIITLRNELYWELK